MAGFLMFNQAREKWKDGLPNKTSGKWKCRKMKKEEKSGKCEEKRGKKQKMCRYFLGNKCDKM